MLADFNGVCMSATPGHDKLRLGFGEFDRISELLQKQYCKIQAKTSPESLLDEFSSFIYDVAPLRMIVPPKTFKAVIIDIFR